MTAFRNVCELQEDSLILSFSDDDVEEAHPMDGNDSDYDPKKEAKREVMILKCLCACYSAAPGDRLNSTLGGYRDLEPGVVAPWSQHLSYRGREISGSLGPAWST